MSKNNNIDDSAQRSPNQNNLMSEDPGDGNRNSFTVGKDGTSPVEKQPPHDRQDQSVIESFGDHGVATTDKEG